MDDLGYPYGDDFVPSDDKDAGAGVSSAAKWPGPPKGAPAAPARPAPVGTPAPPVPHAPQQVDKE